MPVPIPSDPADRGLGATIHDAVRRGPDARAVLLPIALYLLVRGVGVVILAWMAGRNGGTDPLTRLLSAWDGKWYLGLAEHGYDGVPADLADKHGLRDATTPFGFLPGYPLTVRTVGLLPGLGLLGAGLWVNAIAGSAAAVGIARLGRLVSGSPRVGLLLVVLFAGVPMGLALSMTYTEALFSVLAVWALVAVLEEHWYLAGGMAALAGLVRSTATAVILAVVLAALVALWHRRDDRTPLVAVGLAPLGFLTWLLYVAARTDRIDGWFELRSRGWDDGLSAVPGRLDHLVEVLSGRNTVLMDVVSVGVALVAVGLLVACVGRVPWPLIVYAGTSIAVVCLSVGFNVGNARLLLPAMFVLLIPPAQALARLSTGAQVALATAFTLIGAWYSGYALAVYPFAI